MLRTSDIKSQSDSQSQSGESKKASVGFSSSGFKRVFSDSSSLFKNPADLEKSSKNESEKPSKSESEKPSKSESEKSSESATEKLSEDIPEVSLTQPSEPPSFKSISSFEGLDYVGYIILKERLNKETGEWVPIDEFRIIGTKATSFKDTRIAYNNTYRYKMNSIMKVTFKKEIEDFSQVESKFNLSDVEREQFLNDFDRKKEIIDNLLIYINKGLKDNFYNEPYEIEVGNYVLQCDGETIKLFAKEDKSIEINALSLMNDRRILDGKLTKLELSQIINESFIQKQRKSNKKRILFSVLYK